MFINTCSVSLKWPILVCLLYPENININPAHATETTKIIMVENLICPRTCIFHSFIRLSYFNMSQTMFRDIKSAKSAKYLKWYKHQTSKYTRTQTTLKLTKTAITRERNKAYNKTCNYTRVRKESPEPTQSLRSYEKHNGFVMCWWCFGDVWIMFWWCSGGC